MPITPVFALGTPVFVKFYNNDNSWAPYGQSTAVVYINKATEDGNSSNDWYFWQVQHYAIPGSYLWSNNWRVDYTDSQLDLNNGVIADHDPLSTQYSQSISVSLGAPPPNIGFSYTYQVPTTTTTDYTVPNTQLRWIHDNTDWYGSAAQSTFNPRPGASIIVNQNQKTSMDGLFLSCFKDGPFNSPVCPGNNLSGMEGIRPGDSQTTVTTTTNAQTTGGQTLNMWTTIYNNQNQVVATGFTPFTFAGTVGQQYTIVPSDYQQFTFKQWDNGSQTRNRIMTYSGTQSITAYFNP